MSGNARLNFLRQHGARRMRAYDEQPILPLPGADGTGEHGDESANRQVDWGLEQAPDDWSSILIGASGPTSDELPRRFIDGSQVHQTITAIPDAEGHPVPIELAEIGGVCVRAEGRSLTREFEIVERVVCMIVDPFPWDEIEA